MPVLMPNALVKRVSTKQKKHNLVEAVGAKWLLVASISFDCVSASVCLCAQALLSATTIPGRAAAAI